MSRLERNRNKDSHAFIVAAKTLIEKIEDNRNTIGTAVDLQNQREDVQKEITSLFNGLQNPTLPSAFKLRDTALRNGFNINPKILNEMSRFD